MTRHGTHSRQQSGEIVDWNDARGFGFIVAAGNAARLFFHVRDWRGSARPLAGQAVRFVAATQRDGRACAHEVQPRNARRRPSGPRSSAARQQRGSGPSRRGRGGAGWLWTGMVVAAYGTLLGIAIERGRLPVEILFLSLLLSGVAWIAYALDKRAAQHGHRRIPEAHLHLLELAGGWPGALLAQRALRHKNRKSGYQAVFWCVVAVHTAALAFWGFHA